MKRRNPPIATLHRSLGGERESAGLRRRHRSLQLRNDLTQRSIAKSIVLIEDNADVREMLKLRLVNAGHTVFDAGDGPSGVKAVQSSRPQVALVDLDLPGFDGFEVARQVRSDHRLNAVRLIALSGFGSPEDRARSLSSGFDEHLVKPVEFDRLVDAFEGPSPIRSG